MSVKKLGEGKYLPRFCDALIQEKLGYAGAVEIRGPKWCGKAQSALQRAASSIMMQDPDKRADYRLLAATQPSALLRGARPHLIDEWQEQPLLWDAVRYAVDQCDEPGQFMLTGSAAPTRLPSHSGAGRIACVEMAPMRLAESGESTREVSLKELFDGANDIQGYSDCDVERMVYLVCRRGWPRAVTALSEAGSLEMPYDYLGTIADEDISRTDGVRRNPQYARLDTSAMGEPAFCAVVTPGGFAQRRKDGVLVLPITCLTA